MEVAQRHLDALLEWSARHVLAQRGRRPRLLRPVAELPEPGHDAPLRILFGLRPCALLRLLCRRPRPRLGRRESRRLALARHEPGPEYALGFVLVMSAAAQPDALHRRFAPAGDRIHMVKLEPRGRAAAVPVLAHEAALAPVALHTARFTAVGIRRGSSA